MKNMIFLILAVLLQYAWQTAHAGNTYYFSERVKNIQHQWETINYDVAKKQRQHVFQELSTMSFMLTKKFPNKAEAHIWHGIVLSSLANEVGGLKALGLVKKAKRFFETAIDLDKNALSGSALTSLGVLYYKVPGWPISFGNKDKAKKLLTAGLKVSPNGVDSNYFLADFLISEGKYKDAIKYLKTALKSVVELKSKSFAAQRKKEILAALKQTT